jgi:hypothetical protein
MFSEADREMVLHIRNLFPCNDRLPKYHEDSNGIIFGVEGETITHMFLVSFQKSVLKVLSLNGAKVNDCSEKTVRRLIALNAYVPMGRFCLSPKADHLILKIDIPMEQKPTQLFITSLIYYACDTMEKFTPLISSVSHGLGKLKEKTEKHTYH